MVGEVEVLVVHPDRVGQPAGDLAHALAVARHVGDPGRDQREQAVVVETSALWLEDHDRADVHGRRRLLQVEEGGVDGRQPVRHAVHRLRSWPPKLTRVTNSDRARRLLTTTATLVAAAVLSACGTAGAGRRGRHDVRAAVRDDDRHCGDHSWDPRATAASPASPGQTPADRSMTVTIRGKTVTPTPGRWSTWGSARRSPSLCSATTTTSCTPTGSRSRRSSRPACRPRSADR